MGLQATLKRRDGTIHNELIARVYTGNEGKKYSFDLIEDDGESTAYQKGSVARTQIRQQTIGQRLEVEIAKTAGTYKGAPVERNSIIELVSLSTTITSVSLNGSDLTQLNTRGEFDKASRGWFVDSSTKVIFVKTSVLPVDQNKRLVFEFSPSGHHPIFDRIY